MTLFTCYISVRIALMFQIFAYADSFFLIIPLSEYETANAEIVI